MKQSYGKSRVHHLDASMRPAVPVNESDIVSGVLGFTLSRNLGYEISNALNDSREALDVEHEMKTRFEVESLFPGVLINVER